MTKRQKPRRVFIWKDFREWKPTLESMFPDILTPELEAVARQNPQRMEDAEDCIGCQQLIGHSWDEIGIKDRVREFRWLYSHIRVFHACRPMDIQSYYENGVMLRRKEDQIKRFREIFLSGRFPELSEAMLQHSIQELASGADPDGVLDLGLDDKWTIQQTGQYLVYGSEYLHNLVSQLPVEQEKKDQCHAVLRQIGTPTMFQINLPSEYASDTHIRELIPYMIMKWAYNVAHSRIESRAFDFTFTIRKPLPAEHICGYFHPARITDKDMGGRVYLTATGEYEDPD